MADINYNDHASKAAPAVDDFVPIWDVAASQSKKATIASLFNTRLTGGGIVATGGFTLTVPATGTAALLGLAQTFTAIKTFSAGLSLGGNILSAYALGTWAPIFADADSGGNTATVGALNAYYAQLGDLVWIGFFANAITTAGMTGGAALRIRGLPFPVANQTNFRGLGAIDLGNCTFTGYATLRAQQNTSICFVDLSASGAAVSALTVAGLTSGTAQIIGSTIYRTA